MPRENAAAKAIANRVESHLKGCTEHEGDVWLYEGEVQRISDKIIQVKIPTGNHFRYFTVKITENM